MTKVKIYCLNGINICYFAPYMPLYWRSWKECHFWAHPVE